MAILFGGEEYIGVESGEDEGNGDVTGDGESRSLSSGSNNDDAFKEVEELFLRSFAGRFGGGETDHIYVEDMAVNSQEYMSHVETRSYMVNAFFGGARKRVAFTARRYGLFSQRDFVIIPTITIMTHN